jgi:hypothetical protein
MGWGSAMGKWVWSNGYGVMVMGYKYILSDGKSYLYFILYIKIGNPTTVAYMDISARGDISYI